MLQMFEVTITETLKLVVEVEAENQHEAEQMVSDNWRNSEYILDADNFVGVKFEAIPVNDIEICSDNRCTAVKNHEPGKCLVCGSDELDYDGFIVEDGSAEYRWLCKNCGVSGREFYDLVFNEHILD